MDTITIKPQVVVILAAGLGSRLLSEQEGPKPLRPVAGRALILRVLDRFIESGVKEAVVILGYRGDEVRAEIEKAKLDCKATFVFNPDYKMNNGLSVLAAREVVGDRPFFLSMSDHIFEKSLIDGLALAPLPNGGLVLAVDRKLETIYDMDDATKVRTDDDLIVEIQKELEVFDAVDTGLFMCTEALFTEIEGAKNANSSGDCSLSEGVTALAVLGLARVHDVGKGLWQDVDTPGSVFHANKLFGA